MGCGKYTIAISIGSNIEPARHITSAVRQLEEYFEDVRVSTLYRTRPLTDADTQPEYVNGVAIALTTTPVQAVIGVLHAIEAREGRLRNPQAKFDPRTLDLDLLLYEFMVSKEYHLPSADLESRDFVLLPAAELLPNWRHPLLGMDLETLAASRFPAHTHILGPADFCLMLD